MTDVRREARAIYPGTFDPVTNGHMSLIDRACNLFDWIVVAVASGAGKDPMFTAQERFDIEHTILYVYATLYVQKR